MQKNVQYCSVLFKIVQNCSVLFKIVQCGAILFILPEKSCIGTKKNWNIQKKALFLHFFSKIFGHIKKKQYLCTRFRKGSHG